MWQKVAPDYFFLKKSSASKNCDTTSIGKQSEILFSSMVFLILGFQYFLLAFYNQSIFPHLHVLLLLRHPLHPEHLRRDPEVGPVLRSVESDLQVGEDGREEKGGRIRVRSDSRR